MKEQTLMAKDFINTYLNGRYEEGKDESTDVIVNMISTLERELSELRKDKEILDWLERTDEPFVNIHPNQYPFMKRKAAVKLCSEQCNALEHFDTVREAITNAMLSKSPTTAQ